MPGARPNVLRSTAPLPVNQTLRFPPATRHGELAPYVGATALDEVESIGVGREGQFEGAIEEVAVTVSVDQSLE